MFQLVRSSLFLSLSALSLCPLLFSGGFRVVRYQSKSGILLFDSLSCYLILLVLFLGLFRLVCFGHLFKERVLLFLLLSLGFSSLCFCVKHAILFWCFYELSMLPLLFLIFFESPYSERFIAGWYFACYLLITSLPLVLILIYLSYTEGRFFFRDWGYSLSKGVFIYVVLAFVFFTKVPLLPFHTWLPIVHAEATRIVSIFLSGYIMKLGLLGVFRCTPFIFNSSFLLYAFLCCLFRVFFLLTAANELDGKRWLAFLRLSHIVVPIVGFFTCSWESVSLTFLFCFGHGLSAGLVFGVLWFFYDRANTRNWLLIKSGVRGKTSMLVLTLSLLSLCSFPPTIQFFCEVNLLSESSRSFLFLAFWCAYLFLGGLVPLVLCGHMLIRRECFETARSSVLVFFSYFFVLCSWCYFGVFLL